MFRDVIRENLKRGIRYTFFIPNNQVAHSRQLQLINDNKNNKNLKFVYLEDNFLFFAPNLDCVLHFYKADKQNTGFIGLANNNNRYYIKIPVELFHSIYGNLSSLKKDS